jgi:F0F1-type ATP synthase assembly protein I
MNSPDRKDPSSKPQPTEEGERDEKRNMWLQIARYSQIGFMLPAATLIGWFLGSLLDKWLHTTWIYIAGLVLGMITGFVELIRMLLSETDAETKAGSK